MVCMDNEFLTTKEVSEMLQCSDVHVTKLVKRGHFPGTRKMDPTRKNSALRIPRQAVELFMQSQIVTPEIQTEVSPEN